MRDEIEEAMRRVSMDPRDRALVLRLALCVERAGLQFDGRGIDEWLDDLGSSDYFEAQRALEQVLRIGPCVLPRLVERAREQPLFAAPALAGLRPASESFLLDLFRSDDPVRRDVAIRAILGDRPCPELLVEPLLEGILAHEKIPLARAYTALRAVPDLSAHRTLILRLLTNGDWERFDLGLRLLGSLEWGAQERWSIALTAFRASPRRSSYSLFRAGARLLLEPTLAIPNSELPEPQLQELFQSAAAVLTAASPGYGPAPLFEAFDDLCARLPESFWEDAQRGFESLTNSRGPDLGHEEPA